MSRLNHDVHDGSMITMAIGFLHRGHRFIVDIVIQP
jgi:hypothetical protein